MASAESVWYFHLKSAVVILEIQIYIFIFIFFLLYISWLGGHNKIIKTGHSCGVVCMWGDRINIVFVCFVLLVRAQSVVLAEGESWQCFCDHFPGFHPTRCFFPGHWFRHLRLWDGQLNEFHFLHHFPPFISPSFF